MNESTVFLASCKSKNHVMDERIVRRLSKLSGLDDVFETHVNINGKNYCIAARSSADKARLKKLRQLIDDQNGIKFVKTLTEIDVPF